MREVEKLGPSHSLNIPNSVADMLQGSLGEPQGGWPKHLAKVILKGETPKRGRPGARLAPVKIADVEAELAAKIHRKPSRTDVMSYLMYPEVFVKFAKNQAAWGNVEVLPTPAFFYGMEKGDEIAVEIEAGKLLVIKFLTVSEPHPDGTRTVFFELNGQPREVTVRDNALEVKVRDREKADPAKPGQVGAPIPGAVTSIAVEHGTAVEKGAKLLVMEAMKMQTTVSAPVAGRVTRVAATVGQTVEPKDLLVVIE
jgi:pyruvate carboxylase